MTSTTVDATNFLEVIHRAFNDMDMNVRSSHEEAITNLMRVNPDNFVQLCTSFFNDEKTNPVMRKTVSVVLKLGLANSPENQTMWTSISSESKNLIKESGLMNLVDSNDDIKKVAADLVANVFALDCLHDREWEDLLENLSNNLNHEDLNIQKSAILTIGYICEVLFNQKIKCLTHKQIDSMITGICLGLKSYDEKTLTALKALEFSICFLTESIKNEAVSDYIMNLLLRILNESIEAQNYDIIRTDVICLTEISKLLFNNFQKYHEQVYLGVAAIFALPDKNTLMVGIEFFRTMISLEVKHPGLHYMRFMAVNVLEKTLESLFKVLPEEFNSLEPDENAEIQSSALFLMTSLNTVYLDITFENLIKFISVYIEKDSEVYKCVALSALESLLECPFSQRVAETLFNVFFGVTSHFAKDNIRIKIQTGSILSKIALYYPTIFMEDRNFATIFPMLMREFEPGRRNYHVANVVCRTFDNLAENADKVSRHAKSQLVINHESIIETLFKTVEDNEASMYYNNLVYSTILNIIRCIVPSENLNKWFSSMWSSFLKIKNNLGPDLQKTKIENVSVILNLILQLLIMKNMQLELTGDKHMQLVQIVEVVLSVFQSLGEILPEMLLFLTSLIELEKEALEPCVDKLMKEYIGRAIEQKQDTTLFQHGISSVGHLVKIYGSKMEVYTQNLLPFLIDTINDGSLPKEIKIHIFFALADIAALCYQTTTTYLDRIVALLELAFSAVVELQVLQTKDDQKYCRLLRETLMETVLSIIHNIYYKSQDNTQIGIIQNFLPKVIQFAKLTTVPQVNPDVEYIREMLILLVDIYIKDNNPNMIDQQLILDLYTRLTQFAQMTQVQNTLAEVRQYLFNGQDPLKIGS